jgi:hypothetical protein
VQLATKTTESSEVHEGTTEIIEVKGYFREMEERTFTSGTRSLSITFVCYWLAEGVYCSGLMARWSRLDVTGDSAFDCVLSLLDPGGCVLGVSHQDDDR